MNAYDTALEALQNVQNSPGVLPGGMCDCTGLRDWRDCRCEWGALIQEMLHLGYGAGATEAARKAGRWGQRVVVLVGRKRWDLLRMLASYWSGTATSFAAEHGVSRTQMSDMGVKVPRND